MMDEGPDNIQPAEEAHPHLLRELRRLERQQGGIPEDVDALIRRRLRQEFLRRRSFRPWRFAGWSAAAAAAVLLGAVLWVAEPWRRSSEVDDSGAPVAADRAERGLNDPSSLPVAGNGKQEAALAGDLTSDGRVDMLDAFALARRLAEGSRTPGTSDLTGDGVVDGADVDALAMQAVSLEGRSG